MAIRDNLFKGGSLGVETTPVMSKPVDGWAFDTGYEQVSGPANHWTPLPNPPLNTDATTSRVNETPTKKPFSERFNNSTWGKNYSQWSGGLDTAANVTSMFHRGQRTFDGQYGDVREGIQKGWDATADSLSNLGPYGQVASLAMKAANVTNNITGAIFGATDGMTKTDAVFDSPLGLVLGGLGIINQITGQKAKSFTKDESIFESVGASYSGADAGTDLALKFQGKKYGGFSSGARKDANALISEMQRQQTDLAEVSSTANNRFDLQSSMSAINGNAREMSLSGGYQQNGTRVGRYGFSFEELTKARKIIDAYRKGGQPSKKKSSNKKSSNKKQKDPFTSFLESFPMEARNQWPGEGYNVRRYWELHGKPKNWKEALAKEMYSLEEDGWHASTVAYNEDTDEYEFMKASNHPTIQYELDWYNSDDPEAVEFRKEYELQKTEPYYKYVPRKTPLEEPQQYKQGGVLTEISFKDIPKEYLEPYYIAEISFDSILPEFKEGGKMNVIPEGALHARLHHMENSENITKKGIPVVSETEDGKIEQQAEIERNEVILRLEVTQKLEELLEKYNDSEYSQKEKDSFAIEAGKLLTYELLENTIDNTGLLNEIN